VLRPGASQYIPDQHSSFKAYSQHIGISYPCTTAENIEQAKGNECSQYKSTAAVFSSSLPIFPIHIFSSDTHITDIVKIWMGQMGRLEEKIAAVLLY
jgi:hypothetical protein